MNIQARRYRQLNSHLSTSGQHPEVLAFSAITFVKFSRFLSSAIRDLFHENNVSFGWANQYIVTKFDIRHTILLICCLSFQIPDVWSFRSVRGRRMSSNIIIISTSAYTKATFRVVGFNPFYPLKNCIFYSLYHGCRQGRQRMVIALSSNLKFNWSFFSLKKNYYSQVI